MKYGDRLKELRRRKKLSQKELTDKLNLNRSTYARYETSATQPDYDTLKMLADYFNVTIDYILGHEVDSDDYATDEGIDPELQKFIDEVKVWYKDEPKNKEERLEMMKKMFEVFKDN